MECLLCRLYGPYVPTLWIQPGHINVGRRWSQQHTDIRFVPHQARILAELQRTQIKNESAVQLTREIYKTFRAIKVSKQLILIDVHTSLVHQWYHLNFRMNLEIPT